jgi:hypothetical protein
MIYRLTEQQLNARIDKGIEYLDKVKPGWEKLINLDKLNMGGSTCVCNQLNIDQAMNQELGFYTAGNLYSPSETDELWKKRIREKLQGNLVKGSNKVDYVIRNGVKFKVFGESHFKGVDYITIENGSQLELVQADQTKPVLDAKNMIPGKYYGGHGTKRMLCIQPLNNIVRVIDMKSFDLMTISNLEYAVWEVE